MEAFCLTSLEQLAPYAEDWDRLAGGLPFRGWAWASTWWRHYGEAITCRNGRRLFVLAVFAGGDRPLGLAPWFLETSAAQGRVLRLLGSGEVCSDHLSLLCEAGHQQRVAEAIAGFLCGQRPAGVEEDWDLLELAGVDAEDATVAMLAERLAAAGNTVSRRPGPNCWRIALPESWDDYLQTLSKTHRKQLRRTQRELLDSGRVKLHTVARLEQLPAATETLIQLHQRRSHSLGRNGCFASQQFSAFHREVMPALLRAGQLQLHTIELDGRTVAAEYQLAGGGEVYAYQAGIDPEAMHDCPGRLAHAATIRRAIEHGCRGFDFLRGDEPYKAHWRAEPRAGMELRVVPARVSAQVRNGLWTTGQSVKGWIKSGLRLVGARSS